LCGYDTLDEGLALAKVLELHKSEERAVWGRRLVPLLCQSWQLRSPVLLRYGRRNQAGRVLHAAFRGQLLAHARQYWLCTSSNARLLFFCVSARMRSTCSEKSTLDKPTVRLLLNYMKDKQ
jgi:hypothetical protein